MPKMGMREKLIEFGHDARMNALWHNAPNQSEYMTDMLIDNGVTIQKWISVKERLPEDVYGKDREKIVVLVFTKSGNVSQCARMADYECIADETLTKVEWIKNGEFYWSKNKAVTHWMPLPEPPKGGADMRESKED